jgi:hypothetical protein
MCLSIKEHKIRTSTKDRVVYKKLGKNYSDLSNKSYYSPYQDSPYKLGRTKKAKSFTGWNDESKKVVEVTEDNIRTTLTVEKGLHSYLTFGTAFCSIPSERIIRCIIPKGTPYILGYGNEIVSLALKPLKEVR